MIRRLKTSWTAARKRKPCPVWMYLRSQTQSRFGSARAKSRSTRSGAEARFGSRTVVLRPAALAVGAADAELAHQPGDALLADLDPVSELQLRVDPRRTVDLLRLE